MRWRNIRLIFLREVRDQLRDRRTLFMITILPVLLYPMLGLGIVEMLLTFSEQRRTVVVLNSSQLPSKPELLDEHGIAERWYAGGATDAVRFRVVTDRPPLPPADAQAGSRTADSAAPLPGEPPSADLLNAARLIADRIQNLPVVGGITGSGQADAGAETPERQPPVPVEPKAPRGRIRDSVANQEISRLFAVSGIQVLILVPDGYSRNIASMEDRIADRSHSPEGAADPRLTVVRNSADDKSLMAFGRVRNALENWEDEIRENSFRAASLPAELQRPARLVWLDTARDEQVAASVWSKLLPALLVIMALTGAFYPAIDLGAGEKERGTMETLLISPAKRVEVVLGKFLTILLFSIGTALLNLLSMGITGQQMAAVMGDRTTASISLDFPGFSALLWLVVLLIPLAALFSALCLALATFARSTKEGQYYLSPLLMVVMGLTMFCLPPAVEMTPLYSVVPVINVALLLKGLLLNSAYAASLTVYAVPVLVSSVGYSMLALWWAIELYHREDVLFREAEKFDLQLWMRQLLRTKDAVPAFHEAVFCFILILLLQFVAMSWMQPDLASGNAGRNILQAMVVQQLVMIACPAVFMGVLLTTSLRATFRLRPCSVRAIALGIGLALAAHPLSLELSHFLVSHRVFPPLPAGAERVMGLLRTNEQPAWLLIVVFAVTPSICEELAFRGFILSGLARGGRLAIAIVISSMMFGIMHLIPQQAFNAALLGLLLGLLAIYSRSLFPAIAFHFVNNTIATFHAGGLPWLSPDGVFLSRDADTTLRYETPLLIICSLFAALMILQMVRAVIRDQDLKRRGLIPAYHELPDGPFLPPAAGPQVPAGKSV